MKLFNKTISLAIVFIMIVSLIPTNIVNAGVNNSESNPILYNRSDITNFPEAPNQGYVLLNKTAEWVDNEDNIAKVEMSLEGKGVQKKTDVVLVIDRSGSMSDKIKVNNNEVPVVFTANDVSYQYSMKTRGNTWYSSNNNSKATISMIAYIDANGIFKGYKSGSLVVSGLDIESAKRYRQNRYYGAFDNWTSLVDKDCANAIISIFNGKKAKVTIGDNQANVIFPTSRDALRNTNNNYSYSTETKIESAKVAAKKFVSALLATTDMKNVNKIGVVSYSSNGYGNGTVYEDSHLSNNVDTLNTAITSINATGGTHIQAGIAKAQQILSTSTADNRYIVVLSDGEPTYSYKATEAISATTDDFTLNYPSDIDYKLNTFDTSIVMGTGSSYNYSGYNVKLIKDIDLEEFNKYYSKLIKDWIDSWYNEWYEYDFDYYYNYYYNANYNHYYNKYYDDYINVANNGIPTISQALIAKKSGIQMYSVGFDVTGNLNAIYTMKHVASSVDNFYLATDDLSGVFTNIAGKIAKAGTNAKVKNISGADAQIGYNFTILQDASHPVTATQGTPVVSDDLTSINWDLGTSNMGGDITETPAKLTYYIKLNVTGSTIINKNQILNTCSLSSVVYKNYLDSWCQKNFPSSVLTAGDGTLNINYYLSDRSGNPINSDGIVIPFKDRVLVFNAFNKANVLNSLVRVSDYAKSIHGYVLQSNIAKDESGVAVEPTIIATRATIYLNFPYYVEPTFTVKYDGNGSTSGKGPVDNNRYKQAATVTVLGNESLSKSGYRFKGWSNTRDGASSYVEGDSFNISSKNLTLYAVWDKSQYTLNINYAYAEGATFDTYTDELSANESYSVASPKLSGWTASNLVVSGKMLGRDVTETVYYSKNQNKLINNTMYSNKGVSPLSSVSSPFSIVEKFDYVFGFEFSAGQDAPSFDVSLLGKSEKYNLSDFKLYEGNTLVSSGATVEALDKTKITAGNIYTVTYRLKASSYDAAIMLEITMDNIISDGVINPISITSKTMPEIE